MLVKGEVRRAEDAVTPEEEIKDPFVLEFLGLKDEYSESDLEDALVRDLESFLLELGGDFAFVGRQRRLRVGDRWFRIDLLFFHRRLRCLVRASASLGRSRKLVLIDIDHGLITDRLINMIRRRIRQVREQEAEAATGGELELADRGDQIARVAAAAPVGRRVDRADADPVRRRATGTGERDDLAGVFPQVRDAANAAEHAIRGFRGITRRCFRKRLGVERLPPRRE